MSIINDKINQIKEVKENIKQVLIDKGIDMTEVPFTEYPNKISDATEPSIEIATGTVGLTIESTERGSANISFGKTFSGIPTVYGRFTSGADRIGFIRATNVTTTSATVTCGNSSTGSKSDTLT